MIIFVLLCQHREVGAVEFLLKFASVLYIRINVRAPFTRRTNTTKYQNSSIEATWYVCQLCYG